jgi:hypothetical protein
MTMTVSATVNGELITALTITNLTERPTGENTYRWVYTRHDLGLVNSLMSAQEGEIVHVMENGAMALIAKVAQAASETEVSAT